MENSARRFKVIVNVAVIADGNAFLVKYRDRPDHQKGWFIPHALVSFGESPEAIARQLLARQFRDLEAEPRLSHVESFIGNDGSWHLSLNYAVRSAAIPNRQSHEEIAEGEWFHLQALPPRTQIAHGGWAIDILAGLRALS